jgi:hypothetical protein
MKRKFLDLPSMIGYVPVMFYLERREKCASQGTGIRGERWLRRILAGISFWECEAVARKMMTFVPTISLIISTK